MAILSLNTDTTGLVGKSVAPRRVTMVTTDNIATITAAGYMDNYVSQGFTLQPTDVLEVIYDFNELTKAGSYGKFKPSFSLGANSTITLELVDPGDVVTPTITDHIAVYTNTTGTISDDAATAINGGNIQAGLSGTAGYLSSFPSTATSGQLQLEAQDNAGDFIVKITNKSHGQATTYDISDVGGATGSLLVNALANADPNANTVAVDVTVGQAALAGAGTVTLLTSAAGKQYKIREMYLNSNGTNFSGGGGDRLLTISDGTTDYSVIPAATMQSLVNARWGDTGLPFPASAALNTSTVAAANVTAAYSGGTADYTAGSLVLSIVFERVA